MAQLNMVEIQAAVPAKPIKVELSAPKAKAASGSSSNSFSKHLQRLTRRNSESKDLPRTNQEAIAESPEKSNSPFPIEQKVEALPVAQEITTGQKPAGQEEFQQFVAGDEVPALDGETQSESEIQQVPSNMPLNNVPVLIAQETVPELPKAETGETGQNPGLASLLNEIPPTAAQVAPLQEDAIPKAEEPKVQAVLQQPAIPETTTQAPVPLLDSLSPELPVTKQAKTNDDVKPGDAAAQNKPVTETKLLLAMQATVKEPAALVSDMPVQPDPTAGSQEKPARFEETMAAIDGKQPVPETAAINESPIVATQSGLTAQPVADSDNLGAKTPVLDDGTISDAESQVIQTVPDEENAASTKESDTTKQADKSGESKKSEAGTGGQSELKFRAIAGMEIVRPKTEQTATDVKKLIAFESKRSKSDNSEVMPAKSETAASSTTSDGESLVLLAGKSGLESDKPQLLRTATAPAASDLPVEPEKVLEQIVKKAEMMVKLNSSEMKIQLQPEFLGKMTIKIAVEEGMLTAKFITDSHQVKHMLDSNLNTLRQSLEAQGIRVEKTEVNVQLNNGGMFDGSGQNPQESWQRYQFMNEQYPRSFTGQGYQTGTEQPGSPDNDDLAVNAIPEPEYGIGNNGTMNFLV